MNDKLPQKGKESILIRGIRYIYNTFTGRSVPQTFLRLYLVVNIIAALTLMLPISRQNPNDSLSFIDAIFTSVAAFSTTGLAVKSIPNYYSFFGQLVVFTLFQVGGIGLMSLKVIFALLLNTRLSIRDRSLVNQERGTGRLGGTVKFIKTAIIVILVSELILATIIGLRFYFVYFNNPALPYYQDFGLLIWHALFLSVSAVNNAGLDITGVASLAPYVHDIFLQTIVIIGIIIGGIGFPVIYELKNYFEAKRHKEVFHFSVFTKITVRVYFAVALIGVVLAFGSELIHGTIFFDPSYNWFEKFYIVFFHVLSSRSTGFTTVSMTSFSQPTIHLMTILMFIGASPASTGGGIRTTTLLLGILAIISVSRKTYDVTIFQRHIPKETIEKSLVVIVVAGALVAASTFTILLTSNDPFLNFSNVFFEVISAFGTTGFSLGATRHLNTIGKTVILICMFIGQQGITLTLLQWNQKSVSAVRPIFVEEDVLIS
jgi:Trk-type K+ transport system membrane component